jgi:PAS domain S-box-containing protein
VIEEKADSLLITLSQKHDHHGLRARSQTVLSFGVLQLVQVIHTSDANAPARRPWCEQVAGELFGPTVQVDGIGIYETDFAHNRTRFSPALCAILGLPVGTEMTYPQASRLFYAPDRAAVQASVEAAGRSPDRGKWSGVQRVLRADGAVRWVSILGRRLYRDTPDGPQPVRSIGAVIDMAQLKKTERALGESERRLRLALDAAKMGTFEADIAATHALIDAQEARLLGLPEDTRIVSVDELRKRVPFEDLEASDVKQKRMTEEKKAYHHEFRLRLPDGSERWLGAYADVRSNRIFGVNFDVTERKRAEAALRESEARLRIATSGAGLGIFERNIKSDRTVWVNDRMYEIFGRSQTDGSLTRQQFIEDYLHPNDTKAFEKATKPAMLTGGDFHLTCRIRRKDGSLRWLQMDGKVELAETGEPSRALGVVADITERKALERRAGRLSQRLLTIQEQERKNIAQELHDSTVQHLVAASLTLMRLRTITPSQGAEEGLCDEADEALQEAMKELRTFSYLMHPPALRASELGSTLREYVDGLARRTGLDIRLRLSPKANRLPLAVRRPVFRIVQEALANVYRHARASHAGVELRLIHDRLHVIVSDDGRGAGQRKEGKLRSGVGMRGIKARLEEVGGDFRTIRLKPRGFRVHAVIPVG